MLHSSLIFPIEWGPFRALDLPHVRYFDEAFSKGWLTPMDSLASFVDHLLTLDPEQGFLRIKSHRLFGSQKCFKAKIFYVLDHPNQNNERKTKIFDLAISESGTVLVQGVEIQRVGADAPHRSESRLLRRREVRLILMKHS